MERMKSHAERFSTEVINDHIHTVDLSQRPLRAHRPTMARTPAMR